MLFGRDVESCIKHTGFRRVELALGRSEQSRLKHEGVHCIGCSPSMQNPQHTQHVLQTNGLVALSAQLNPSLAQARRVTPHAQPELGSKATACSRASARAIFCRNLQPDAKWVILTMCPVALVSRQVRSVRRFPSPNRCCKLANLVAITCSGSIRVSAVNSQQAYTMAASNSFSTNAPRPAASQQPWLTEEPVVRTVQDGQRSDANYISMNQDYPGLTRVSDQPPVYTVDDFLTAEECERLQDAARADLGRSIVVDGTDGKVAAPSRTSSSCYLNKNNTLWFSEKISKLTGEPILNQEPAQVCRYTHGQYYRSHHDAFDLGTEPGKACYKTGGQRIGTVLVYLNDVAKGGGTHFDHLSLTVTPARGKALIFFPCTLDGALDTQALHCAQDAEDEKWVSQVWLRQGPFV